MKLAQKTEMIVIVGLIVYLSFLKPFQFVHDILATSIGKALALGGIVYIWKFVSPIIAGLLMIGYIRCVSMTTYEGMENASESCTCPAGYIYDAETKKCRNPKGETKSPEFCPCPTGYFWDVISGECKASSPETATPVPIATADTTKAPAVSTGAVTSSAPMTTPSAVQDAIANMSPPPATMGGVQPTTQTTESFSPY